MAPRTEEKDWTSARKYLRPRDYEYFLILLSLLQPFFTLPSAIELSINQLQPHFYTMAAEAKSQTELQDFESLFSLDGKIAVVVCRLLGSLICGLFRRAYVDAALSVDRRLEGSWSPRCFWVYFPDPISAPPTTDGGTLPFSFLQAGCSKVYITSRKAAACDSACAALNALPNKRPGAQAISVPADSAKFANVEALVKKVMETTDHVDILFANAGATWGEKFDTHPDSAFAKVMDLNVKSVFNTIRLCVLFTPPLQG